MSISGLSGLSASYSYAQTVGTQHRQPKELEDLQSALQSGDITGAQQALAAFQQHAPGGQHTQTSNANSSGDAVITDISALGKALSAGDLSGAQDAFSTLQTDLQNNPPPPLGGPRGGADSGQGDQVQSLFSQLADALKSGDLSGAQDAFDALQKLGGDQSQSTSASSSTTSSSTSNSFGDDISALSDALSSGDLSSAQDAFATLLEDLKTQSQNRHLLDYTQIAALSDSSSYISTSA